MVGFFAGAEVDGLLELQDESVNVITACRLGGLLLASDQIHRCIDGSTTGVSHHDDKLGSRDDTGILHAADEFFLGDVARDTDAKNIAQT